MSPQLSKMTNKVIHFSTIINPKNQSDECDSMPWQRVLLTMCFLGRLPREAVQGSNIPVHVSVSIAEEYGPFTSPVMEAISVDLCPTRPNSPLMDDSIPSQVNNDFSSQEDVTIAFLPLQGTFNHNNPMDWAALSKEIEGWLVTEVDIRSQLWTWGCDAFWLTFVAAYPLFPRGKWLMWDPCIPVEGTFIKEWLERSSDIDAIKLGGDHSLLALLGDIWAEFNRHTALYYPFPLIDVN
ncbi:hypothetical protein DFJ58DRAFT_734536 [Suillus subalutaceus]|uniref:uncharacterized protein n=1 Tax=Suillus subalutaceus TaxID=48586 RepID=UPI001B86A5E0|nr:uncharacterized protein DFJ58DRAFT_734536 [Suillus subalutaceus]KAG1837185.1 hypothetical protein DFJ58DRAFT_734536 [Suillus subalutaceus]